MVGTIRKMTYKGEVEIEVPEMVKVCTATPLPHTHTWHLISEPFVFS